ncbi:MAG TPA: glycosyltransferase family 4 protein [Gemmatimonadales bacterium]|jgi:glycosyltransferase involved in cell wall biosynthesis
MRIAQVSPLYESVPPQAYGGTERVVSNITEELVAQGHDVTLFASGDSVTSARLIPCSDRSLRLDPTCEDQLAHHVVMLEKIARMASEFDLIHYHIDYLHYPISRRLNAAALTTLHGRLDIPDLVTLYREFPTVPVVSISNAQRTPLPWLNWQGTVYHGIPRDLYTFHPEPGSYLAFVGRVSPEKGVDRAIAIAQQTGIPLRIAAKIDRADAEYFTREIEPLLGGPLIELIGEIDDRAKNDFLGNALATVFPVDWPEPFGLVMIESMACGTPVIAFRRGSVSEVMTDGVTGFVVDNVDQAVAALGRIGEVDRAGCRQTFDQRFTADRMARDYLALYARLARGPERHAA